MLNMSFSPDRNGLLAERSNYMNVLLRLAAPEQPDRIVERKPLNLSIVIDRSGSMAGRPLQEALRCASMIVERSSPKDRLSIISYDQDVRVDVPSQRVKNKSIFLNALKSITEGGTTDLHGGWLAGAEQLAMHMQESDITRVLLLSDGNANAGIKDVDQITRHCETMAEQGVATSTYGLGEGFNEHLMTEMARTGQGNSYYGKTAEDLMDPFTEEFDLLSSICIKKVRLQLVAANGVNVKQKNGYRIDASGNFIMPDIAYGSEAWALIKISVPKELLALNRRSIHVLTAIVTFEDENGKSNERSAELRLDILPFNEFAALEQDPSVKARDSELKAARYQELARIAARQRDWLRVERLLGRIKLEAVNNPWLNATITELERYAAQRETESFSKEAFYKSQKMRSRLAVSNESVSYSMSAESLKPSFLRRKLEEGKRFDNNN